MQQAHEWLRSSERLVPTTFQQRDVRVISVKKGICKMRWRGGINAPQAMVRGSAVVYRNTLYLSPVNSKLVYSLQICLGEEKWSQLPENPYRSFGLIVLEGLVTSVGGRNSDKITNALFCLKMKGNRREWSEIPHPMPTSRCNAACVTTEWALIVAGGGVGHNSC